MACESVVLADNWYATEPGQLSGLEWRGARVETADIRSEADLARYQICLYSPSPDRDNAYVPVADATQASMWLPTVGESVTYYYRVRAVDQAGNESALSAAITVNLEAAGVFRDPQPDDPPPVLIRH